MLFSSGRPINPTISVAWGRAVATSIGLVLAWFGPAPLRKDATFLRLFWTRRGVKVWRSYNLQERPLLRERGQVCSWHQRVCPLHLLLSAFRLDILIKSLVFGRNFMNSSPLLCKNLLISWSSVHTRRTRRTSDKWNCVAQRVSLLAMTRSKAFLLIRRAWPAAWSYPSALQAMLSNSHVSHSCHVTVVVASIQAALHAERSAHSTTSCSIKLTTRCCLVVLLALLNLLSCHSHLLIGHLVLKSFRPFS